MFRQLMVFAFALMSVSPNLLILDDYQLFCLLELFAKALSMNDLSIWFVNYHVVHLMLSLSTCFLVNHGL